MPNVSYKFAHLRALMVEHEYDQTQLARKLGISYTTMSTRLNRRSAWTIDEMYLIMDLFSVPHERLHEIFPPLPAKDSTKRKAG